jgi:hypothetical protein
MELTDAGVVVEPGHPIRSAQGRILGLAAIPWGLATFWLADAALHIAGTSRPDVSALLVISVAAVAAFPGVIWVASQVIGARGVFTFLYQSPQPFIRISHDGLELRGLCGSNTYAWSGIGSLDKGSPFRSWRYLRAPSGRGICAVPDQLAAGRRAGSGQRVVLAELVVTLRPDRYTLEERLGLDVYAGFRVRRASDT